ncbi:TIGR04076 family protein [uncultured Fretibacterium sp.]|uniref:TIGR04076 family protein n=1 Tax=uncultured Fretibacterium sp. TaxID=1678694 RepID=UPI002627AC83|nr:TIGR04076 family protein [uncultured Fretibacterium sp.]
MTREEVRTVEEKGAPRTGRPQILLTLVEKRGPCGCHRGHKVGDTFDFDRDRGKLCPMALHAGFPYIDILRYGGTIPPCRSTGGVAFCCPDPDVVNVFSISVKQADETASKACP